MKNEKDFILKIDLSFVDFVTATNKNEAIKTIKQIYKENYNINLKDKEIQIKEE